MPARCTLDTPLRELEWLGTPRLRAFERIGLTNVGELLRHFPKRYEDRTRFDHFPSDASDEPVCVCGLVKKTQLRRIRGRMRMFDVLLEEANAHALSAPLLCRWFNSPWIEKAIVNGQRVVVYGKPKRSAGNIIIAHPEFEVVDDDAEVSVHLNRITPIHRATEGVSPRVMRRAIWDVLAALDDQSVDTLIPRELDPHPRAWALRQIHFPDDFATLEKAQRHLVLEEFFVMQLAVAARRTEIVAQPGASHCGPGDLMRRLHASLPFPLTGAQIRAIEEIRTDLAAPRPMNRLLHGDVGSGKTLVALSAMLLCVESGHQAALMAPTQILAEQHYLNLHRLCEPLGLRVSLRTSARTEDSTPLPLFAAAENPPAPSPRSMGVPPVASGVSPDSPSSVRFTRRKLPHYERPHGIYAVTFSTRHRTALHPEWRDLILTAARHFHGKRYDLFAAAVLKDHVHLLLQPFVKEHDTAGPLVFYSLPELLHSIKSYTAHEIAKLAGGANFSWEQEYFDRLIRSDAELKEQFAYITANLWKEDPAHGAEQDRWSWHWMMEPDGRDRRDAEGNGRDAHAPRAAAAAPIPDSEPHLFVGTHALLYEGAGFTRLGLAVIDEQHKFGVMQRARLREQGTLPDVLVMTATPIPRTLTMTVYGDLDLSTLDELPKGRGKIITAVRPESKLQEAVKFFREHLEAGRQAYIVYPLIDESEKLEAKAAAVEFEKWRELLSPMKCELLHGRVPPEEKDAIMERFRRGETKALIATTVIEVGIDVPNANLMLIENAERFGLAQLHQLRGRIGRGEHKSYCVALTGAKAEDEAKSKLAVFESTIDGFKIAEEDLRLRGPGDLLGTAQSGLPPLKIGDLFRDAELMKLARNAAFLLFERDPQLEQPSHARYRKVLAEGRRAVLSQVS